jgi:hypothetical protein
MAHSTAAPGRKHDSLLSRLTGRLARTEQELEADELREDAVRAGGTRISELADRQVATVCGTVRSVTLRPRVNVPALVIDLYDGSKTINLIWLGRRRIGGIEPGTKLKVTARVTYHRGIPTMFNPAYEILPPRGH